MKRIVVVGFALALVAPSATTVDAQNNQMSFFITSANPGKGGDLGGLAGADAHCSALAKAAGTEPGREALHTVHQHDAPGDDASAHALLPAGVSLYDDAFARTAVARVVR